MAYEAMSSELMIIQHSLDNKFGDDTFRVSVAGSFVEVHNHKGICVFEGEADDIAHQDFTNLVDYSDLLEFSMKMLDVYVMVIVPAMIITFFVGLFFMGV